MSQITRNAIIKSTLKLAESKPINKITVRDIVDDCGITRNTFYYHFRDIYDVLENALQTQLTLSDSAESDQTGDDAFFALAQRVVEHKKLLVNLYKTLGHEKTEAYLSRRLHEIVLSYLRREAVGIPVEESDLSIIAVFYEAALFGILTRWLRDSMPEELSGDLVDVLGRIRTIFSGQIHTALEKSAEDRSSAISNT